jgi:peptidyl-prolyl cis-trans isomerase D
MMTQMRKFSSGIIAKLLLLFLVISFAIWGIGDIFRSGGVGSYAAKVANQTITLNDFQRQMRAIASQMQAAGIEQFDSKMLRVGVLQQLVQQKLVALDMKRLGLHVNDDLLSKTLRADPSFQKPDGTFDGAAFRAMLQAQNLSEAQVLEEIRAETANNFFMRSVSMEDVLPTAPVRQLMRFSDQETRDAWIVNVPAAPAPATVEDTALQAFYDSNKTVLYMEPESRTLEYVALKPSQIDALVDASITAEALANAAKKQPGASEEALKKSLRNGLRDNTLRTLQGEIDDALAGGLPLADALKKLGVSATPHRLENALSTLAKTSNDDVVKTVAEQGFQMADGETSGLLMSKNGTPVIVRVAAIHPAAAQSYEAVASDVRERVIEQARRDATKARVQEVKTALTQLASSEPKEWQSVLDRFNLTALRVTGLKRPGDAKPSENGIPAALREAAFEHRIGGVAGPLSLETGGQMLAIVTGINHPALSKEPESEDTQNNAAFQKLSKTLNQTIQARAFTSSAERHKVKINGQLLAGEPQPNE